MTPRRYGPLAYVPINRRPPLARPSGARVALWVNPNVRRRSRALPLERGHREGPDFLDHSRFTRVTPVHRCGPVGSAACGRTNKLYLSVDKIDV
jgi:hypothetical protein